MGLAIAGLGTILGAVNDDHRGLHARARMTMFRMPIFTWNILVTSVMMLIAFPTADGRAARVGGRPAPGRSHL
jgi:cytochrome c oxidase subunit 1